MLQVRMPAKVPQWAFLPRTMPFPLLSGSGKMPVLLKNDSKSEPLLPVGQGREGGCDGLEET